MEAAMDLMRRISPKESETALSALMSLIPHHSADLLSQVDLPLQVCMDNVLMKEFILCEYNRDADSYRYYEGGVSSVYIWDDDSQGFVACFLIKKDGSRTADGKRGYLQEGSWDAIHVIEVGLEEEGRAHYCLTSTVMLSLTTENKSSGTFNLSGSIRRQMTLDLPIAEGHLCNMGKMIEEMEGKLRNSLDQVYFGKTREMVCTLRPPPEGVQLRLP
ncbi:probable F-actin-capping protein subunit beta isoform X3 [Zingiber officinale]|uniref:probable F-actin-capping protein subunit beta isoform X3 n=1 Tax=Zingiber officinale TaxID=94328 RepID=UPI001C4C4453|nr:probable F-actin-capping protein subunit beta isoform X3 [Zingiber officinale]XP_042428011.1 probable F-actin-capping protein subunit beta isoform X3 [Zingiber officinale]